VRDRVRLVILLMIFHATHARWMTILRRPVEAMASSMGSSCCCSSRPDRDEGHLYIWIDPVAAGFGREALTSSPTRRGWLNVILHRPQRALHPVRDVRRLAPVRLSRQSGSRRRARR
jgi:hypothetical protein